MKIENTILLVLDMQERLLPVMDNFEEIIRKNEILIQGINELKIPTIYTEQFPKGLGITVESLKNLMDEAGSKSFEKLEFSAFNTVKEELNKSGKNSVIVTGIETHVCVYQTIKELIMEGYEVYIPYDAVSSRDIKNKENGLNLVREMGACVTNVETILFDLLKTASHPSFKVISKLIK